MQTSSRSAAVILTLALLLYPSGVRAQAAGYPILSRDDELRLAMSAGPLNISQEADVWILGKTGFEKVIAGKNGWSCLVVRSAANRIQLAPHCLNPQAGKSVLRAFQLEGRLQMQGMTANAIDAELDRAFKSGELPLPEGPAYAYMLSSGQVLGPAGSSFKPHFMLYVPYATNASIGGDPSHQEYPFVGPYENHPLSTVVVIMTQFVNPADVKLPPR